MCLKLNHIIHYEIIKYPVMREHITALRIAFLSLEKMSDTIKRVKCREFCLLIKSILYFIFLKVINAYLISWEGPFRKYTQ